MKNLACGLGDASGGLHHTHPLRLKELTGMLHVAFLSFSTHFCTPPLN